MGYTTVPVVSEALGPGAAPDPGDPYLARCVDAANVTCARKRAEAGYVDLEPSPPDVWPADVVMGATLYAVALWRERASVDGYQSFDDFTAGAVLTGGAWPQIKRLLGIPRGMVDAPLSYADARSRRRDLLFPPGVNPLVRR